MTTETKSSKPRNFADSLEKLMQINKTVPLYQFYSVQITHGKIVLQGDYNSVIRKQCETTFGESFYLTDENWIKLYNKDLNIHIYLTLPI